MNNKTLKALTIFLFFAGLIAMVSSQAAGGAAAPAPAAGAGAGAGGAAAPPAAGTGAAPAAGAGAGTGAAGGAAAPAAGAGAGAGAAGGAGGATTPAATPAGGAAGGMNGMNVMVNVGNAAGQLVFDPQTVNAMPGGMVTFNWVSGKHSVVQSDMLASCVQSTQPNAFTTNGPFTAPKTFVVNIPSTATGKMWYFCAVPGHCQAGMYGTIVIGGAGAGGNSTMPSGSTNSSMPMPSGKSAASRFSSSSTLTVGAAILMAAAFLS